MENAHICKAARLIKASRHCIALTGAGISVESGIPDFRGKNGLWTKYNPDEYVHIDGFNRHPEKIWEMMFDLLALTGRSKPNPAHYALAELERADILKCLITQNIDNLHSVAGSTRLVEFHGNTRMLECQKCRQKFAITDFELTRPPLCPACGVILKPDFVFFGEMISPGALIASEHHAELADVVLVIGTSAVVYPAAAIPAAAKAHGAAVIECNLSETELTDRVTDIFIGGKAGETMPVLLAEVFA